MQGHSMTAEPAIFSLDERKSYWAAQVFVATLPEMKHLRCHELARAVQRVLTQAGWEWEVIDGKYGLVDHSWLVSKRGNILDVYAVAMLPMVQLVNTGCLGVRRAREGYPGFREGKLRTDIEESVVETLTMGVRVQVHGFDRLVEPLKVMK